MQIVIYISCNIKVGQGHLSRCLNLAHMLKGNNISFTGNIDDFGINLIKNYGYDVGDVEFADLSIIDDYGISLEQEIEIAKKSVKIMVIDDSPNRPHYCDILLDQNYVSKNNEYLPLMQKYETQFLLGPEYLLLAPEYFEPFKRITKQKPERCLVFFTGGDCQGMTLKAIEAIKDCDFATDVVIGLNNPQKEQIVAEVDKYPQITLHIQTTKMRELIDNADFSIGEFGFSTWERLARKLPMIGIITSDYQEKLENYFVKNDLVISLGWREKITIDDIKNAIYNIRNIDLSGYENIGNFKNLSTIINFLSLPFSVRKVTQNDSDMLLNWRNQDYIRQHMATNHVISQQEHDKWFAKMLVSAADCYLVFEFKGLPIGLIYFNKINNINAEWGFYIGNKEYLGSGFGFAMEIYAVWYAFVVLKIKKLLCYVKHTNKNAYNLYIKFGFSEYQKDDDYIYLELNNRDFIMENMQKFINFYDRKYD